MVLLPRTVRARPSTRRPRRTVAAIGLALAAGALIAGCGGSTTTTGAPSATEASATSTAPQGTQPATTVTVDLTEYKVSASAATVPAGQVTFAVANTGALTHEIALLRTELEAGDLPTAPDRSAVENDDRIVFVAEVEDLAAGATTSFTETLSPGHYLLLCNLVLDGDAHYAHHMVTDLTVT